MSAETPNRAKTRAELAFEKYEQTQKAKVQEQQIKLQRVEQSYWYRFLHKMDQKLVIRNRMTRELRKMIFYITLPVVATFILTNPQVSEKIILNYVCSSNFLIELYNNQFCRLHLLRLEEILRIFLFL